MRELLNDFATWLAKKTYTPPKVEFVTQIEGVQKWAPIKNSSHFIPDWFKKLPTNQLLDVDEQARAQILRAAPGGIHPDFKTHGQTIKTCPGMQDILSVGYTMPYWGNTIVTVTEDGKDLITHSSTHRAGHAAETDQHKNIDGDFATSESVTLSKLEQWQQENDTNENWGIHPASQYSTMIPEMPEHWASCLLKLDSIWEIHTPPGWSMLQIDPTYQFNNTLEAMPGILNTDYWHTSNMFFFVKEKGVQFEIPYMTPLITYIPIKRDRLPLEVRMINDSDIERHREISNFMRGTAWGSSAPYRNALKYFGYTQKNKGGKCPFHKS